MDAESAMHAEPTSSSSSGTHGSVLVRAAPFADASSLGENTDQSPADHSQVQ